MDERNGVIEQYFRVGLTHRDIVAALKLQHDTYISLRQVQRILAGVHCRRRHGNIDAAAAIDYVREQLRGSGQLHGYRWMYYKCLNAGFHVSREAIRVICKAIDPEGVEQRKKRRLNRRSYFVNGPNYCWHLDGYDKLKPFGLCVSGCIDGFSRRIVWLKACRSNNDPSVIASFFVDAITEISGCPRIVRGDFGTENVTVRNIQHFLRRNSTDDRRGERSYIDGASTANQRIESWWGVLRKECAQYWMTLFGLLKEEGLFNASFVDKSLMQFCFMGKLQVSVQSVYFTPTLIILI